MHIHTTIFPSILANNSNQIQHNPSSAIQFNPTPASAMALMVVAFLLILFFLAYFFLYAHRIFTFSHNIYARPHHHRLALPNNTNYTYNNFFTASTEGGNRVDMPVLRCAAKDVTSDCVVCLDQFMEGTRVKVIPGCGHMFHPCCIDGWLQLHGSCPICRCTRLTGEMKDNPKCAVDDNEAGDENRVQVLGRRNGCDSDHHVTGSIGVLTRRNSI